MLYYYILAKNPKRFDVLVDITVGQLRKKIADAYHLPFGSFEMKGPVRVYEPEDDDSQLRNVGWAQQILIEPYKAQENDPEQSKNPSPKSLKSLLAHNDKYISHLFILLSKENTAYVDTVWELLSSLPSNQKMLTEIQALNITSNKPVSYTKDK